jgi:hypothetical protein
MKQKKNIRAKAPLKSEAPPKSPDPAVLEIEKQFGLNGMKSTLNRARSITVGEMFNGCHEIGMRVDDGGYYYVIVTAQDLPKIRKLFSFLNE